MIREDIILNRINDKEVLDIGSKGQMVEYELYDEMKDLAKSLTGIDIKETEDNTIVKGNMETYDFNQKFDIIVGGDVIEHVDNQGLFLDNLYKHLREDGELILTTPNAKWPTILFKPNPHHTLLHNKSTISEILKRHDFKMKEFKFYPGNREHYNFLIRPFIIRQQMLIICKKNRTE